MRVAVVLFVMVTVTAIYAKPAEADNKVWNMDTSGLNIDPKKWTDAAKEKLINSAIVAGTIIFLGRSWTTALAVGLAVFGLVSLTRTFAVMLAVTAYLYYRGPKWAAIASAVYSYFSYFSAT